MSGRDIAHRRQTRNSQGPIQMRSHHLNAAGNFLSGIVTVELDSNGRFLIPKTMLTYAQIDKEAMLVGTGSKVEIWNPTIYEKHLIRDPGELSKLAEKYLNSNDDKG